MDYTFLLGSIENILGKRPFKTNQEKIEEEKLKNSKKT